MLDLLFCLRYHVRFWSAQSSAPSRRSYVSALCLATLLIASTSAAQSNGTVRVLESRDAFPQPDAVVEVRDPQGRPVIGLEASQFTILQDGRPIAPEHIQVQEKDGGLLGPTTAIVLDASTLLGVSEVEAARAAAVALLQAEPVTSTTSPELITLFIPSADSNQPSQIPEFSTFTKDHNAIANYINRQLKLESSGTPLYTVVKEAVLAVGQKAKERGTPGYVAVFSDGRDNLSAADFDRALSLAREQQVTLVTFLYGPETGAGVGANRLRQFAVETQGEYLDHPTPEQAAQTYTQLAQKTSHSLYTISFTSELPADNAIHSWQILVTLNGVEVQSQQILFQAVLTDQSLRPLKDIVQAYLLRAVPTVIIVSGLVTLLLAFWQRFGHEDSRRLGGGLNSAPTMKKTKQ